MSGLPKTNCVTDKTTFVTHKTNSVADQTNSVTDKTNCVTDKTNFVTDKVSFLIHKVLPVRWLPYLLRKNDTAGPIYLATGPGIEYTDWHMATYGQAWESIANQAPKRAGSGAAHP